MYYCFLKRKKKEKRNLDPVVSWVVVFGQKSICVRWAVPAKVGDKKRDELGRHVVVGWTFNVKLICVYCLFKWQDCSWRIERIERVLFCSGVERTELVETHAYNHWYRVMFGRKRDSVRAGEGDEPAVGKDSMRAENDFVGAAHHGENCRIRDHHCLDSSTRQTIGRFVSSERWSRLSNDYIKLALAGSGNEELGHGLGEAKSHDDLVAVNVLDGLHHTHMSMH
jgi:hypothetical protein